MPNVTVKNIPDDLYQRLKSSAEVNRRSINSEIIHRIERSLTVRRASAEDILARVERLQESYKGQRMTIVQMDRARREGRP